MKKIGILGGMGSYASLEFYKKVLDHTSPLTEAGHIRVILDNNPHIPSRNRHYIYGETSPVPEMIDSLERLKNYPVDQIYIPCNTASCFIPEIKSRMNIDVVDTIEVVSGVVGKRIPAGEVLVLGTFMVKDKAPYKPHLNHYGHKYLEPTEEIQNINESIIYSTKDNDLNVAKNLASDLLALIEGTFPGIAALVLACTELCIPFDGVLSRASFPIIDSSSELAKHLVKNATI